MPSRAQRIAYVSLQAVEQGQDTWATVTEFIAAADREGREVDRWFVEYPAGAPRGAVRRAWAALRMQVRLGRRLRDYDALYVRGHPLAWPVSYAAAQAGVTVVQECNGSYEDVFIAWPSAKVIAPVVRAVQRWQFQAADGVVAVTPGLAEWLAAETGRSDAVVSGNGANCELFAPGAGPSKGLPERYVVFFGQFAPWQGLLPLLSAVREPEWPDIPLVLLGDGALLPAVEEAAASGDRVIQLGRLPYDVVPGIVASAAASIVPMKDESRAQTGLSPLKLYESMACGVPVIASDVPGLAEDVMSCGCGLVVPPGDAKAIARAVRTIVEDPEGARRMGERGRTAALEWHSWRQKARERLAVVDAAFGLGRR